MQSNADLLKNDSEASGEKQDKSFGLKKKIFDLQNDLVENIVLIEESRMVPTAEQDRNLEHRMRIV